MPDCASDSANPPTSLRDPPAHHRPAWGKLALIVAVIAALALAWRYTPLKDVVSPEQVLEWARDVGRHPWAPVALMAAYTPAAFVMFPRPLLTLFAVVAFGPVLGFAYGMAGILLAALATYYAGIALPPGTLRRLGGPSVVPVTEVLRQRGLAAMFAMRVVPVAPFAIEGMIAGAARIRMLHFMLGTFLGMLPGTVTTSVFGDQLATAFEDPSQLNGWLVAGTVVLFAVMILVVRRWFLGAQRKAKRR